VVVNRPPGKALHVASDVSLDFRNQVYGASVSVTVILPAGTYSLLSQRKEGNYYAAPSALKTSASTLFGSAAREPVGGIFWKTGQPYPDQYYVRKPGDELFVFPKHFREIRRSYLSGGIKAQ